MARSESICEFSLSMQSALQTKTPLASMWNSWPCSNLVSNAGPCTPYVLLWLAEFADTYDTN